MALRSQIETAVTKMKQTEGFAPGDSLPLAEVLDDLPWNADGLLPAIAQQYDSGEVLMLAYMNAHTLRLTLESGQTHFWSRSRQEVWHKGAASGNVQDVVGVWLDCDGDTLLVKVNPAGPACHTGARTCFFTAVEGE